MKIIFLDIDGVLNSVQSANMYYRMCIKTGKPFGRRAMREDEFCPIACSNLRYILDEVPDVNIVVSSSWRIGRTLEELQTLLENIGVPKEKVISKTPRLNTERGIEIDSWLMSFAHKENLEFVILDDDSDMAHLKDKLIQTDFRTGLTWIEVEKVIEAFNKPQFKTIPME